MVDRDRFTSVLAEFASTLVTDYEIGDVLHAFCHRVAEVLPVSGAGVMLNDDDGHLRFVAASDDKVRHIETLQIELGEGPCLHAYLTGEQVVVPDLAESGWFPGFASRAVDAGLPAMFSFPMRVGDDRVGALNLYRSEVGQFDDDDRLAGQVLADVATTYILNARALERSSQLAAQLQQALSSRVVIEQAKGRIAEQLDVSVADAFAVLRRHARGKGRKLHDIAREVVNGSLRLDGGRRRG